MASQISHIVYAQKYFDCVTAGKINSFPKIDKDEFLLGCTFPDIRQIDKNIQRRDTHLRFTPLDLNFSSLSSFEAGWKFHLYSDMRREDILNKYKFYSLEKTADFAGRSAKLLEDLIIYDEYNNWEKVVNYFNNPPFPNHDLPIEQKTFNFWYALLAKYVEKKPEIKDMEIFLSKLDLPDKKDIVQNISVLTKNSHVTEILQKIKDEIV